MIKKWLVGSAWFGAVVLSGCCVLHVRYDVAVWAIAVWLVAALVAGVGVVSVEIGRRFF